MHPINRRRFLSISAACAGLAALPARASSIYEWRGVALGARVSILLAHSDAEARSEERRVGKECKL